VLIELLEVIGWYQAVETGSGAKLATYKCNPIICKIYNAYLTLLLLISVEFPTPVNKNLEPTKFVVPSQEIFILLAEVFFGLITVV
jgi:hypothetical protein